MKTYNTTFTVKRLWLILSVSMLVSFSILLFYGSQIYQKAPPIPEVIKTTSGNIVYTRADIERGQNIWQSIGGMQQGSIWGHGSYLAPDWSADWLHREALELLSLIASDEIVSEFSSGEQRLEMYKVTLRHEMRKNTYDPHTGSITVTPNRAAAIKIQARHATSRNSGTPVAIIRSPTQRMGDALNGLRPQRLRTKAASSFAENPGNGALAK